MAITSGFFNSLNGDRKYDARQMGEMFDGLIEDGVFMSIGDALKTVPSSGMTVSVGTGRAWFLHTWTKNDSDHLITVSAAESVLNRIDTIVLDVDNTESTRDNDIVLIKGTPSSNPQRPGLIDTDDHKQIPLADILVPDGSTQLTATNITNIVGTSKCPYVTGPLSIIQNDDILEAWQEEFDTWFEDVKGALGTDTAGQLYNLIQQKVDKSSVLDTMDEVNLTTEEGYVAGALAVKELNGNINGDVLYENDLEYFAPTMSEHTYNLLNPVSNYNRLLVQSINNNGVKMWTIADTTRGTGVAGTSVNYLFVLSYIVPISAGASGANPGAWLQSTGFKLVNGGSALKSGAGCQIRLTQSPSYERKHYIGITKIIGLK